MVEKEKKKIVSDFLETLRGNSNDLNKVKALYRGSDWFYLPKNQFEKFHYIASLFRYFDVFLETAVPTILAGLVAHQSAEVMEKGFYFLPHEKFEFDAHYSSLEFEHFAHPYKLSRLNSSKERRQFCQYYVNDKFENSLKNSK